MNEMGNPILLKFYTIENKNFKILNLSAESSRDIIFHETIPFTGPSIITISTLESFNARYGLVTSRFTLATVSWLYQCITL
jgi:hypothetical protein